jgi:ribosome-associated heat shock protein Hsp15
MSTAADDHNCKSAQEACERLDKWLWFARVVKTRTLATALVHAGKVRLNGTKVAKASQTVKAGDKLTIAAHQRIRVIEVVRMAARRGPATAAAQLYRELTAPGLSAQSDTRVMANAAEGHAQRLPGTGRPTKKERREIDRLKGRTP